MTNAKISAEVSTFNISLKTAELLMLLQILKGFMSSSNPIDAEFRTIYCPLEKKKVTVDEEVNPQIQEV